MYEIIFTKKNKNILVIFLFYAPYIILLDFIFEPKLFKIDIEILVLLIQLVTFCFYLYIFQTSNGNKVSDKIYLIIKIILSFGLTFLLRISFGYYKLHMHKQEVDLFYILGRTFLLHTQFLIYSFAYYSFINFKSSKENEIKLLNDLNNAKLNLAETQTKFLRSQINPHFLYNTLNQFYKIAQNIEPQMANGVLELSGLMRYSIEDHATTNGLTLLSAERTQIQSLINLHQLRYNNELLLKFIVTGNVENKYIAPMILITLTENLFKHGDLSNDVDVAYIKMHVNETFELLEFETCNAISPRKTTMLGGIGLDNIKTRLQALYQDGFSLVTTKNSEKNTFAVYLKIPYSLNV